MWITRRREAQRQALMDELRRDIGMLHAEREKLRDQVAPIEDAVAALPEERRRVDAILSELQGLAELRTQLAAARETADRQESLIGELRWEIGLLREQDVTVGNHLPNERRRVDYVLGEMEGLGALRTALSAARKTAEFQAAFEDPSPLITVCTGTAGRPKLLVERCLKSIREQTYTNLQILVIGDHCIDDTAERIAELNDSRIEFHNLPMRGPYPRPGVDRWYVAGTAAANASQSLARGQFITYLDDDDRYESNRIETLLAAAREHRAEFIWHKFWYLQRDGSWALWGNGNLEVGQVGTAMMFYHNFFRKIPWDVHAYRLPEPGDWNRLRKIKHVRPNMLFVDQPLTWYHKSYEVTPFVAQEGETFLE
jgi:hypothetical protein